MPYTSKVMKTKFVAKALISTLVFSAVLFFSAGTFNYIQGWIFLTATVTTALMNFWAIRNDEELMSERSQPGEGAKPWDKLILSMSAITYLGSIITAGLDSGRFQWSPVFHWSLYAIGVFLLVIGQVIFLIARNENRFFSSVVRIQVERNHTVCETGIYKTIRHPGYLGMMISMTGVPLITGSLWSIIPVTGSIALLIIRTCMEDESLKKELPGYTDYVKKTKYKLIPGLW